MEENSAVLKKYSALLCEVTKDELTALGSFKTNEDCLAVAELRNPPASALDFEDHVFLLDGVGDPGNLGTIIRSLDWFGFRQLVCSPDTADFFNPKVINSTMGSFTRVRVFYQDLTELIKSSARPVFGMDMDGTPLRGASFPGPCLFVLGSESHGISERLRPLLTGRISISRVGAAESLNVAIAAGILCYHLRLGSGS